MASERRRSQSRLRWRRWERAAVPVVGSFAAARLGLKTGDIVEAWNERGRVVVPLAEDELRAEVRRLVEEQDVDALVLSFLCAHRNRAHELRAPRLCDRVVLAAHREAGPR